jgi:HEAT repeat protein
VLSLIALVACTGVLLWAGRYLWESQHPAIAAARGLQAQTTAGRVRAVHSLVDFGNRDPAIAIPAMISALGDDAIEVRVAAAEAVGLLGAEAIKTGSAGAHVRDAVAALLASMKDQEPTVRCAATRSLGTIAACARFVVLDVRPAAVALVEMLDDPSADVRRSVVETLGFVGPGTFVDPPASVVADLESESALDREAAVDSLARFTRGLPRLVPSLVRSMEKARPEARANYARLLARIEPPSFTAEAIPCFVAALGSDDRAVRHLAATQLGTFKGAAAQAVPFLIDVLGERIDRDAPGLRSEPEAFPTGDPSLAAARALAQIAPGTDQSGRAVAALADAVRSGQPERRVVAAEVLGLFGPGAEAAIPALIAALQQAVAVHKRVAEYDPNRAEAVILLVADWSARSLGKIAPGTRSEDQVFAVLAQALQSESPGSPRTAIMMALLPYGPRARSTTPRLRILEKDPDHQVRQIATFVLKTFENQASEVH